MNEIYLSIERAKRYCATTACSNVADEDMGNLSSFLRAERNLMSCSGFCSSEDLKILREYYAL